MTLIDRNKNYVSCESYDIACFYKERKRVYFVHEKYRYMHFEYVF